MSSEPEYTEVEQPFIDQFVQMGWKYTTGSLDHPPATGRGLATVNNEQEER